MDVNRCLQSRSGLATGLIVVWLLGTVYAFWWFQFKDLRPFSPSGANKNIFFDGEKMLGHLRSLISPYKAMPSPVEKVVGVSVLHFWDPVCPCSRFNEQHVRQLMDTYRQRGIRFVVVALRADFEDEKALQQRASQVFGQVDAVFSDDVNLNASIPSSPAAIILDSQQQIAYFGPYSQGAVCSAGSGQFVERILNSVLAGKNPQYINTLAYGCFCTWRQQS